MQLIVGFHLIPTGRLSKDNSSSRGTMQRFCVKSSGKFVPQVCPHHSYYGPSENFTSALKMSRTTSSGGANQEKSSHAANRVRHPTAVRDPTGHNSPVGSSTYSSASSGQNLAINGVDSKLARIPKHGTSVTTTTARSLMSESSCPQPVLTRLHAFNTGHKGEQCQAVLNLKAASGHNCLKTSLRSVTDGSPSESTTELAPATTGIQNCHLDPNETAGKLRKISAPDSCESTISSPMPMENDVANVTPVTMSMMSPKEDVVTTPVKMMSPTKREDDDLLAKENDVLLEHMPWVQEILADNCSTVSHYELIEMNTQENSSISDATRFPNVLAVGEDESKLDNWKAARQKKLAEMRKGTATIVSAPMTRPDESRPSSSLGAIHCFPPEESREALLAHRRKQVVAESSFTLSLGSVNSPCSEGESDVSGNFLIIRCFQILAITWTESAGSRSESRSESRSDTRGEILLTSQSRSTQSH